MRIGAVTERTQGERRVALTPQAAGALRKAGHELLLETGAGERAGFDDSAYADAQVSMVSRDEVFAGSEVLLQVRSPGASRGGSDEDWDRYRAGQVVIGFAEPLLSAVETRKLAERNITLLAVELLPRITRAQSMDALSSQANLAGYQAVLVAAAMLPRAMPMMMTAAGTVQPAKVLVVGAGVAGLQAIATAKRLGAVVSAYDVRAAVKEQVQSLGGKFVELPVESAEGAGGYAAAQTEEQLAKQRELMARVVAESDIVITTAAIPGRKSPVLVTESMVRGMHRGSVIVDLAAERGGNCELTQADQTIDVNGVTIIGDTHIPSQIPYHASQLYANNLVNLLKHLTKEGKLSLDPADEIAKGVIVTQDGKVVHEQVRAAMGDA